MYGARVRRTVSGLAAVWVAALGTLACGEPPSRHAVLVVVDTLRWDHLGAYGHSRPTSPALDALAAEGVRFERAYSPAPWTKPAVASLLTGLYPSDHGLEAMNHRLAPDLRTLAEILSDAGFRTGAVVSHVVLAEQYENGFAQGFDDFLEGASGDVESTPRVTDEAVGLLREMAATGERFFLFVHYFDPHFEYLAHPEFGFASPRAGRLDGSQGIRALREIRETLSDDEVRFLMDRYDEEIRFTDEGIGQLLSTLDELGLRDETTVVVTADHGEEFMERGWLGHTRTLYEELIRVPLIVRRPGEAPAVVPHPVSTVAVTPSILAWLGVDPGDTRFGAAPLGPAPSGDVVRSEVDWKPVSPVQKLGPVAKRAVIDGRYKLVRDRSGAVEVYDLEDDPEERRPLDDPALRKRLLPALR